MSGDHATLIESIGALPVAMVLSNPRRRDNPLEIVNPAFCQLTGYGEAEIVGRNCRFLTGPGTEPEATIQLRSAIGGLRPMLVDILNYRSDGEAFRNGVLVTPLFGADGSVEWFLGSQVDLGPPTGPGLEHRCKAASDRVQRLSPRQRQVLELMAKGLLNKQIAWELKIAEKTVKMHRGLLLERLEASSSAEAIRLAVEAGL